jgi:hypothetical protein
MWACDAQVTRVITDAASRPLDVGRTVRITPPSIRKAVASKRQRLCLPRLRETTFVVRSAPRCPLDERWPDGALEPRASMSTTPPADPSQAVLGRDRGWTAELRSGGRNGVGDGGPRAALTGATRRPSRSRLNGLEQDLSARARRGGRRSWEGSACGTPRRRGDA